MKQKIMLSAAQNFRQVQAAWKPSAMAILNNTPWSLLIREGAQERPSIQRYDYMIPPGMYTILPVIAHEFGFALDNDYPGAPAYGQPCTIILLDGNEALPDFGASSYRLAIHDSFLLTQPATHDIVLDTRTARALFMSLRAEPDAYGAAWLVPTNGYVAVYTAEEPAGLVGAGARMVRLISIPRTTSDLEALIPLAANYVRLEFVNPAGGPVPNLDCSVDLALMDEIPSFLPRKVSEYHWSEDTFTAPIVAWPIVDTMLNGTIEYLELAVEPANPGDPWDMIIYMHSGTLATFTELLRLPISDSQRVTIAFGGPNALPTRQAAEFLGRDPTTGAVAWRFPVDRHVDRQWRIMLDVSTGVNLLVHIGALIQVDV